MDAITARKAETSEGITMDGFVSIIECALHKMTALCDTYIEEAADDKVVLEVNLYGLENCDYTITIAR